MVVYCALALLLARRIRADQTELPAFTQRLGLIALAVIGGLAIQLAVTRVTEPDPLAGIAWRTYWLRPYKWLNPGDIV